MDLGPDDVGYICMPLFHSNAVMVGWAPSIVAGASVGLARRFSVSSWLPDVRRYGATWFNYTGKPLCYLVASPEQPDDADNPLRVAFGNEGAPDVVAAFGRRFGVRGDRRLRSHRGRRRREPGGRHADRGAGQSRRRRPGRRRGRQTASRPPARRRRSPAERRGVRRRDRQHRGQRARSRATTTTTRPTPRPPATGGTGAGDLGYLDDERLPLLRRTHRGLDPGRRRELPRRSRSRPRWSATPTWWWPPSTACPTPAPATRSWPPSSCATAPPSTPPASATWLDAQADLGPKWRPRYVRLARGRAHDGHQQGAEAAPGPAEVPLATGSAATRCGTGTGARSPTVRSPPRTRPSCWPSSPAPAASASGTCRRHGPRLHRRRAGLRRGGAGLAGRPPRAAARRSPTLAEEVAWGRAWQARLAADRWVGIHWPSSLRRARRHAGRGGAVQHGVRPGPGAAAGEPGRHQPGRADAAGPRHRRAEGAAGCRRSSTPASSGASCSASPTPAATWRR